MMTIGGTPLLLFREKKLKVGDHVKITFEGVRLHGGHHRNRSDLFFGSV